MCETPLCKSVDFKFYKRQWRNDFLIVYINNRNCESLKNIFKVFYIVNLLQQILFIIYYFMAEILLSQQFNKYEYFFIDKRFGKQK